LNPFEIGAILFEVNVHLKISCSAALFLVLISLTGSYFHSHINYLNIHWLRKLKSISTHHVIALLGLASLSWSAHIIHISIPCERFLDSGVDPSLLPWPQDLMFAQCQRTIFQRFGTSPLVDLSIYLPKGVGLTSSLIVNGHNGSILLGISAGHHLYLAVVLILSGIVLLSSTSSTYTTAVTLNHQAAQGVSPIGRVMFLPFSARCSLSSHLTLSLSLLFTAQSSMVFAHHASAIPAYPYLASDYATVLCLFVHHINIASLLTVGSCAHASIFCVRHLSVTSFRVDRSPAAHATSGMTLEILNHRCIISGHLTYATIFVGLHSFGLYTHNDTIQSLGRPYDMFSDNSIQLKPIFAIWVQSLRISSYDIEIIDQKVILQTQELGTADFLVHHIHAFTIHVTLLILLKGILYARSSRLIADKADLGFRYPCDGPGRGGTCQVSPFDHIFLGMFWMYNAISVVIFHYFWKMQSDVWGSYNVSKSSVEHISNGDFPVNSGTINGWLRNFLWSQAAQVIHQVRHMG
jgi:photosystem I P700 chlorophyll a apoprotein A1